VRHGFIEQAQGERSSRFPITVLEENQEVAVADVGDNVYVGVAHFELDLPVIE